MRRVCTFAENNLYAALIPDEISKKKLGWC